MTIPSGVYTGRIPSYSSQTSDMLMMTGASRNHGAASFNCLYSMVLADPYASFVYVDFGLSLLQRRQLFSHFATILQIQQKMKSTGVLAYCQFDWDHFPSWFSLSANPSQNGGYAWKVVSLVDVFFEWRAVVYWVDGGCVIREGISRELSWTRHHGLFSPRSAGTVGTWVHSSAHEFMVKTGLLRGPVALEKGMLSGGVLMLDFANATIRDQLVPRYLVCAYTQKCVSPRETDRSNHRQDQAALTLLAHDLGVAIGPPYFPALRMDGGGKRVLQNLLLKIQDVYSIRVSNRVVKTEGAKYERETFQHVSRPVDVEWVVHWGVCLRGVLSVSEGVCYVAL